MDAVREMIDVCSQRSPRLLLSLFQPNIMVVGSIVCRTVLEADDNTVWYVIFVIRRTKGNKFIDPSDVTAAWNNSYPINRIGKAILATMQNGLNGNDDPDPVDMDSFRKRFLVE